MKYKIAVYSIAALLLLFAAWKIHNNFVSAPESAYKLVEKNDQFCVRSYGAQTFIQTTQKGILSDALNKSFHVLAGYIFAKHRSGKKIAMTAPVSFKSYDECWKVRFVLPEEYRRINAPVPVQENIEVYDVPIQSVAVRSVKGAPIWQVWQKEEAILRDALRAKGWQVKGDAWFARYNPPWIPSFMRRNEIMIEVYKE